VLLPNPRYFLRSLTPSTFGGFKRTVLVLTNVCAENSDADVYVMQPADEGTRHDASHPLDYARDWRILMQ
jgi:hypothetical protein